MFQTGHTALTFAVETAESKQRWMSDMQRTIRSKWAPKKVCRRLLFSMVVVSFVTSIPLTPSLLFSSVLPAIFPLISLYRSHRRLCQHRRYLIHLFTHSLVALTRSLADLPMLLNTHSGHHQSISSRQELGAQRRPSGAV